MKSVDTDHVSELIEALKSNNMDPTFVKQANEEFAIVQQFAQEAFKNHECFLGMHLQLFMKSDNTDQSALMMMSNTVTGHESYAPLGQLFDRDFNQLGAHNTHRVAMLMKLLMSMRDEYDERFKKSGAADQLEMRQTRDRILRNLLEQQGEDGSEGRDMFLAVMVLCDPDTYREVFKEGSH